MRSSRIRVFLIAALVTLSGCAPLAKVSETKPRLGAQHGTIPELRRAEQAIADGEKLERSDPSKAIGLYLSGAKAALTELRRNRNDRLALRDYDFALSRVFAVIRDAHLDPWTHPLHVPAPGDEYVLTDRPHANPLWKPQDYDLIPADELDVSGKYVLPRITRQGAGAALIAVRRDQFAAGTRQRFLAARIYFGVTAVAHFSGHRCEIEFLDPLAAETVNISGRTLPSAADFTAPVALGLSRERPDRLGLRRLLLPGKYADTARLTRLQPYDSKKIPVLFVHGLQDTPASWAPMVNALRGDPILRRNYQFWVFSYPSGYPVPYSAMLLRRELDALKKVFPDHRPIVLVGHSMGGIISRLMISDSGGDKIWRTYFNKSPEQTAVSPKNRELLTETLIFKPRPEVARVIFISTPHRGSIIASNWVGRIGSSIIRMPIQFVTLGKEALLASVQDDPTVMRMKRMPNSIDTLSPNNRFVKIMNTLPIEKGLPYHSIIGDRGRGDTPSSSDGVVAYWSSHLDGAKSERIVPSKHGAHQNPQGIAEVSRILKEHVGR